MLDQIYNIIKPTLNGDIGYFIFITSSDHTTALTNVNEKQLLDYLQNTKSISEYYIDESIRKH